MSEIELHRKLLGDAVRNRALHAALSRAIKPGRSTLVDVGAGTGFISFLARRLGARHCTLIEYSEALALARELARANRMTGLSFVQRHSTEVLRPPRADIVISETLGNYALEEHLLETMADARRFLAPGGILMPCTLRQFAAPVVTGRLQREIDIWPDVGYDLDLAAARAVSLNNMYVKRVAPGELPGEAATRTWDVIDFTDPEPPASRRQSRVEWTDLGGRTVHGLVLWWEADLLPGITLSTSPYAAPTHWDQVYLPLLDALAVKAGDTLEVALGSDTRPAQGVRVTWATRLLRAGKPVSAQQQDLKKGRL